MDPIASGTECAHSEPYEGLGGTRMTYCGDVATHRSESGTPVCRRHAETLFGVSRGADLPEQAGQSIKLAFVGIPKAGSKYHLNTGDYRVKCRGNTPVDANEPEEELPHPGSLNSSVVASVLPRYIDESELCPKCFPRKGSNA